MRATLVFSALVDLVAAAPASPRAVTAAATKNNVADALAVAWALPPPGWWVGNKKDKHKDEPTAAIIEMGADKTASNKTKAKAAAKDEKAEDDESASVPEEEDNMGGYTIEEAIAYAHDPTKIPSQPEPCHAAEKNRLRDLPRKGNDEKSRDPPIKTKDNEDHTKDKKQHKADMAARREKWHPWERPGASKEFVAIP
ncbi:hypothetical protein ACHAQA_008474 [Verticillium albo-atrum]